MLIPFLMSTIAPGAPPPPVVEPAVDRGREAGAGKEQERTPAWWEGEWIIPGVTHYLPEKPPEDIVPLRPKVAQVRERLAKVSAYAKASAEVEYKSLVGQVTALSRSVKLLEIRAEKAALEAEYEQAISDVVARYRAVAGRIQVIEATLAAMEAERKQRLLADDEEFLTLLMEIM